jgi:tellurite resistance protein TerB
MEPGAAGVLSRGEGTMRISEIIHDRVERYRDRTFLKAAMAAGALTAYADGSVSVTERFKVEEILERLERLHIYDAQKAVEKFEEYVIELEDNTEQAEKVLLGKLERMAGDRDAADLIAHIAIEISYADKYMNQAERMQFAAICDALGLEAKDYSEKPS